jgi:hypothetical protein
MWVDKFAQINTYFKRPFYDVPTADFAEGNREAFAIAEFLTILAGNNGSLNASGFTGPVMVSLHTTIVYSLSFCDASSHLPGNCRYRGLRRV